MNLETLQAMSDDELNDLAAIKILWGGIVNVRSDNFTPCTDMNDAMGLLNSLIPKFTVSMGYDLSGWNVGLWTGVREGDKYAHASNDSLSRAITIASILAKGSDKG